MNSEDMAMAILHDPQFQIPTYPKISNGYTFIHIEDDSLLVDGGTEKQLFRGKAVNNILPYVIEKCDGFTHINDIVASSDEYSDAHLFQALSLMYARGLLQEGYVENKQLLNHPLYNVYDRIIDGTRANKNVEVAIQKVKNKNVVIEGVSTDATDVIQAEIKKQLSQSGINVCSWGSMENITKNDIVIGVASSKEDIQPLAAKAKKYYQLRTPFVFLMFNGSKLYLGPYFEKDVTICFQCYVNQLSRLELEEIETSAQLIPIGISLAVPNLIYIISNIYIPSLTQNLSEVYDLNTLTRSGVMFTKLPYCEVCTPIESEFSHKDSLVCQYESTVEFPSRKFLSLKDHQNHYKSSNLDLAKVYKNYYSSPRVQLPENKNLPTLKEINTDNDMQNVAKILLYTTGIKEKTGKHVKKWSPTGGNLSSVYIYFLNRKIDELDNATYFYQAFNHEFQQITKDHVTVNKVLGKRTDPAVIGTFIFTGSIERLSKKYRYLSYRLANLDAGVAFAQGQIVGKSLGYELVKTADFDDEELASALGIYDIGEIVTIVADIRKVEKNG